MSNAFWIVESTNGSLVAISRPSRPAAAVCRRPFASIDQAERHIGLLEEERAQIAQAEADELKDMVALTWAPEWDAAQEAAEAAALSEANHPLRRLAAAAHAAR